MAQLNFIQRFGLWLSGADSRQPGIQSGATGTSSNAAMPVTTDSAMQISAVWACVKILTETISSLPIIMYDIAPDGVKTINTSHDLAKLFANKVNKWQTKNEFFESIIWQLVLHGNSYSVIQKNKQGKIIALIPLMTAQMQVGLDDKGNVVYKYTEGANITFYAPETIWHNKLLGNGIIGLDPLSYATAAVGIAQGAEKAVSNIYRNGGKTSGVLTIDKKLTPEQRESIKKNFQGVAEGNENRLFVLEAGMKYTAISLSPQDIELLQSRRFQVEEICRFWGVPSVLVNDTNAGTTWGSGISEIVQGWYKLGLRPYLERLEASMRVTLLPTKERAGIAFEFDFKALLRSDFAARIKAAKEGVQGGVITPNEARKQEGLEPKEGGDQLFLQAQMTPIDQLPVSKQGGTNVQQ